MESDAPDHQHWATIYDLFNDHKKNGQLILSNELGRMSQGEHNIVKYFLLINNLFDALTDVYAPVANDELVLRCLQGLNEKYEHVSDLISVTTPFPTFAQTCSLLTLQEMRSKHCRSLDYTVFFSSPSAPAPPLSAPAPLTQQPNSAATKTDKKKNKTKGRGNKNANPASAASDSDTPASAIPTYQQPSNNTIRMWSYTDTLPASMALIQPPPQAYYGHASTPMMAPGFPGGYGIPGFHAGYGAPGFNHGYNLSSYNGYGNPSPYSDGSWDQQSLMN
jgi:hypothetical protein